MKALGKRYLGGQQLADELGGDVPSDGTWFVAARVGWHRGEA